MKRKLIRNKKARYAGVTVLLTAMIVTVTVLLNMVVSAVTERYSLNTPLVSATTFDVTEPCYELLDSVFEEAKAERGGEVPKVTLMFCDTKANVSAEETVNYYLYHTVNQLAERFDNIEIRYEDVIANPTLVEHYRTQKDLFADEEDATREVNIYSDSIIVICEDYHRAYRGTDFYVYDAELTTAWGYAGEKKIASAIMRAVEGEDRIACILSNHGEMFYDYELVTFLEDAGYTAGYISLNTLYTEKKDVFDRCELLISYNPSSDLLTEADYSEVDILDEFLARDGTAFLVFMGNTTPRLPNFERYLQDWGIDTDYAKNNDKGTYTRYTVQDSAHSLTSDNATVYGAPSAGNGKEYEEMLNAENEYVVFRNATSFSVTNEGYMQNGESGSFISTDGTRELYPLYKSYESAECWANGKAVAGGESILMSVTKQTNPTGGASYVGAVSSVQFATYDYMRSAVYQNQDALLRLCSSFEAGASTDGNGRARLSTEGVTIKPFLVQTISTITTTQMLRWTLVLSIVPAVLIAGVGTVILIRRRRA
ncbi:MAG: Gldg family protein [Clostridia bacterium]|nr:Gldg family protein [Clostridia bacterium]